ncbi:MAG: hypothetical protein ACHQNV_01205 [Vicinamibacteria bacterium]
MSRRAPATDCYDLTFQGSYPIGEPGEVALEDYAREMSLGRETEAIRDSTDPSHVGGIHVCGLGAPLTKAMITDIEDFARALVPPDRGGLGWS